MEEKKNSAKSPDIPEIRDKAGRFAPGSTGNPKGRPKIPKDVKEMLKAATADAAKLLIDTMKNQEADLKLRVDCAERVLDRVYGKASQPIEGAFDFAATISIATEQEARQALEALGYGEDK